jgi:hypothetical protein
MAFIAVIVRNEHRIPILKGGDGPDAECMMVWEDYDAAIKGIHTVPLACAFPVELIDLDDAAVF